MTTREATYALARQIPYLLQQGGVQTIDAPMRHGISGALVVPTEAGSTVTISRPDGTAFADAQAVVVASSVATYDVASTAAEDPAAGWEVEWSIVIDGLTYPRRKNAYLCEYVPPCPVHVGDLYVRVPELEGRIPQSQQATRGTGDGWQPQIDAAYYEFLRELIADARPVWKLRSADDYFDRILIRACQIAVATIPAGPETSWARVAKELYFETAAAKTKVRLGYSDEPATFRRSGPSQVRLAPVGRPSW